MDIEAIKSTIQTAVLSVDRPGISSFVDFLNTSDFYQAPCSTKFHLAVEGGLAQHSLNVLECASELNEKYGKPVEQNSVILASIGHDLCKVNFYAVDNEPPTDPQITYLRSLCMKAGVQVPLKLNKSYASICIDHLKSMKKPPLPEFSPAFTVKDQFPLGHGEKSLLIMQRFVPLTDEEALSIRWHMATFDPSIHFPYPYGFAYNEALKKTKLVSILVLADFEASNLMEAE